jgi:atypical dual specificity phosphatase
VTVPGFHTWIAPGQVVACSYPASRADLEVLAGLGVRTIINLTGRSHEPALLSDLGIEELLLPVPDLTAPSAPILEAAVARIDQAIERGEVVAVHCQGGLGRTGTVLAAWLVSRGAIADEAIAEIRRLRTGSIETAQQEAAVQAFADDRRR